MTTANRLATTAAALLALGLTLGGPAGAQTTPGQGSMPMPGMTGPGSQQGAMPGMMGGEMGRMMEMMHRQMATRHAMQPFERIEGKLAFYRAELRVTDAQQPQWNAFAEAVRAAAGTLKQAVTASMQQAGPAPAPEQMERRIAALTAQAEAMRSVQAAARPLYAVLSDEQKRTADALMEEHLRSMGGGMGMRGGM